MSAAFRRLPGRPPLLFGHRGVRGPRPENTLAAFALAAAEGADGVELDVRLASTGEVIVLHDPDLLRVTDGRERGLACALAWSTLSRVDLGGEKIPRLDDVLAFARDAGLLVNVELKHDEARRLALVRGVAQALARTRFPLDRAIVSSFHPTLLTYARFLLPSLPRAFLCHFGQRGSRPFAVGRALGADALHPEWSLLGSRPIAWAQRRGLLIGAWTVNDEAVARRLAEAGVDSLITDRPGELRRALGLARASSERTMER